MVAHKAACHTLSKAFLKSMKISAVVNINSLERDELCQAELCPRNTVMMMMLRINRAYSESYCHRNGNI